MFASYHLDSKESKSELVRLISAARDVISVCNFEFASFLQMNACDFVKLSDVMGFSQGVQKHLARWINSTNECRR